MPEWWRKLSYVKAMVRTKSKQSTTTYLMKLNLCLNQDWLILSLRRFLSADTKRSNDKHLFNWSYHLNIIMNYKYPSNNIILNLTIKTIYFSRTTDKRCQIVHCMFFVLITKSITNKLSFSRFSIQLLHSSSGLSRCLIDMAHYIL